MKKIRKYKKMGEEIRKLYGVITWETYCTYLLNQNKDE